MNKPLRYFLLAYGLFETFVFTGSVMGWTPLHAMLRQEGVYSKLCDVISNPNATILVNRKGENVITCEAQDKVLNLAFTIGSFFMGFTSVIWGFLLDKYGLRIIRLLINVFMLSGTILLTLTKNETSYLLFPALILMCTVGVPLRLADLQIANLFPHHKSTVITLYSGAFAASASVFVFIKYGYDSGLPFEWACFALVILSIVMLPITLFLLPAVKLVAPAPTEKQSLSFGVSGSSKKAEESISGSIPGKYVVIEGYAGSSQLCSSAVKSDSSHVIKRSKNEKSNSSENVVEVPLKTSFLSLPFAMHQYWISWLLLFNISYAGTLHLWTERTYNDAGKAAFFADMYGLFQVSGLFLGTLSGMFMDWRIAKVSKEEDPENRRLRILQSSLWPIAATTATAVMTQVAKFFDSGTAIWVSLVGVTLFRTFILSIGTAYISLKFPVYHFNKLIGLMSTMAAFVTLLQFPLFIWETSSPRSVLQVNIFDSICLLLACSHPISLMITPLQRYFVRQEVLEREKAAAKAKE